MTHTKHMCELRNIDGRNEIISSVDMINKQTLYYPTNAHNVKKRRVIKTY